jgi:hypothetical protein
VPERAGLTCGFTVDGGFGGGQPHFRLSGGWPPPDRAEHTELCARQGAQMV